MDRLQRVNNTLFSQISRLQNIRNTIGETGNLAEQARSRVESTEQLIEIASRELEKAKVAIANVVSDWDVEVGLGESLGHSQQVFYWEWSAFSDKLTLCIFLFVSKHGGRKPHCS